MLNIVNGAMLQQLVVAVGKIVVKSLEQSQVMSLKKKKKNKKLMREQAS